MRTKLYSLMVWMVCLIMASCTNQEIIEQSAKPVHSNTLNVLTEKQESRSVLSYEGTFYWTENDYIGVYGTETENARFHFTSQADGVSTFTGNMNASEEKVSWAYFPYSEKVDVSKKQLSFPMVVERTVSNENHSPMIGRVEANNTVRFYHTGGILHLKIVGLPEHAAQLVIASEGENSPCLAGTAVIDDITADGCTYRIDNGSKEVVYDVRNLKGGEYIHAIYLPLQVGTYEKIKVALKNEVGDIIKERSLSNLVVTRGKMTETPVLNFSIFMYCYELPQKWFEDNNWDGGVWYSNGLYMLYQNESIKGRFYVFACGFGLNGNELNPQRIVSVRFDEHSRITHVTIGFVSCLLSDYKEESCDITVFDKNGEVHKYFNITIESPDRPKSRIIDSERRRDVIDFTNILNVLTGNEIIDANETIVDVQEVAGDAIETMYGELSPGPEAALDQVRAGANIVIAEHQIERTSAYNGAAGNAQVISCGKRLSINEYQLTLNIENPNDNLQKNAHFGYVEWGIVIRKISYSENPERNPQRHMFVENEGVGIEVKRADLMSDFSEYTFTVPIEAGYIYYIRPFLGYKPKHVYNYTDLFYVIGDEPRIRECDEIPCKFIDGKFCFEINVIGECLDPESSYYMYLTKSDKEVIERKEWNMENNKVNFSLKMDSKDMNYKLKEASGLWNVKVYINEDEPIDSELLFLRYDVEPDIHLDVQIIDGPRPVNASRSADDDDEEKYYVKYQVTAKTEGSGWIDQVKINVDGRPVKTGKPKNEGESFTYTGSKTYKDKSELPTISCEGILINGAGNKQSVPASINVATKVR